MEEQWRKVKEYPDYTVSNLGRIKRINPYNNTPKDGLLKLMDFCEGYKRVSLSRNNRYKNKSVHTLVARAFIGKIPKGYHINHKDCNRSNNQVNNLEIVTPQQNVAHQVRMGHTSYGENNVNAKLKEKDIPKIKKLYDKLKNCNPIAKLYNVHITTIQRIVTKKTWGYVK